MVCACVCVCMLKRTVYAPLPCFSGLSVQSVNAFLPPSTPPPSHTTTHAPHHTRTHYPYCISCLVLLVQVRQFFQESVLKGEYGDRLTVQL
jgi:hypothetical protein